MPINYSCLQSAYGRHRSFWHAGTHVQDPSQVKLMVVSPVCIRPWPVHLKLLAGLQEGLWPTERETSVSQRVPPGSRPPFEACQQASIQSWPAIILQSTRCCLRRNTTPQDPHNHNQMFTTITVDSCHFPVISGHQSFPVFECKPAMLRSLLPEINWI